MAENHVTNRNGVIVIGGSAGSLEVIIKILADVFVRKFPILIVLHRKGSADSMLVDILSGRSALRIVEAEEKEPIKPGVVYIAPADYHLLIEKDHTISLDDSEKVNFSRPSIDVTFESAAQIYGSATVAVLLSGGSVDGVEGLKKIKSAGGLCIVQDPETAVVDFMPQQAVNTVAVDKLLHANDIGAFINQL